MPWTLANAPAPTSHDNGHREIGLDRAIAIFDAEQLPAGYSVPLPLGPSGVYTASVILDKVSGTRTVHLDQYSGEVIYDASFRDLGPAAQAIELGISIHTG